MLGTKVPAKGDVTVLHHTDDQWILAPIISSIGHFPSASEDDAAETKEGESEVEAADHSHCREQGPDN